MLLPALNKAREKARTIACVNNMKQLGNAAQMYAGDNQDSLPAIKWPQETVKYVQEVSDLSESKSEVRCQSYLCPAKRVGQNQYGWKTQNTYLISGAASMDASPNDLTKRIFFAAKEVRNGESLMDWHPKIHKVKSPSSKIYLTEDSNTNPQINLLSINAVSSRFVRLHGKYGNICRADGGAQTITLPEEWFNSTDLFKSKDTPDINRFTINLEPKTSWF